MLICVLNLGGEASRQSLRDEVNSVKFVNVEKITGEYSVFVSSSRRTLIKRQLLIGTADKEQIKLLWLWSVGSD